MQELLIKADSSDFYRRVYEVFVPSLAAVEHFVQFDLNLESSLNAAAA